MQVESGGSKVLGKFGQHSQTLPNDKKKFCVLIGLI